MRAWQASCWRGKKIGRVNGYSITLIILGRTAPTDRLFPQWFAHSLPCFEPIHRFISAQVQRDWFHVLVVKVDHAERQGGRSNHNNLQRVRVGSVDLLVAAGLIRRRCRRFVAETMAKNSKLRSSYWQIVFGFDISLVAPT